LIILLLAIGPFLIPVRPLDGLVSAQQVAADGSKFITVPFDGTDGIDIHYVANELDSADAAPTFVLLHGSLFNAFTWSEVMDFFGERGQVVAYDQIPYGLSEKLVAGDWTERNPYSSEAAVDQLFTFLDALDVNNVVLVGSSYGGTLAVQAALSQPERVVKTQTSGTSTTSLPLFVVTNTYICTEMRLIPSVSQGDGPINASASEIDIAGFIVTASCRARNP
jgi:dipeptidyl aminopeptidase/acylaminoacyl peptidase